MNKFKIGDRVKVINGPPSLVAGTIVGSDGYGGWTIDWDNWPFDKINWSNYDLAYITSQGPVRTKTVKEIVGGIYGRIQVGSIGELDVSIKLASRGGAIHEGVAHLMNATELRAAAATLLEIAEALDQ